MLACNRDGELPLLFNGGIFTTDNNGRIKGNNNDELPTFEGEPVTPDFRRWMGCYFMSQNQRWLGWPARGRWRCRSARPHHAFLSRPRQRSPPPARNAKAPTASSIPSRSTSGAFVRWHRVPTDSAALNT